MWVELSLPGTMQLIPVFDSRNDVIDLLCAVASPCIARLLNEVSGEPVGRRLSALVAGHTHGSDILGAYLQVARTGQERCFKAMPSAGQSVQHSVYRRRQHVIIAELQDVMAVERARSALDRLTHLQPS